MSGNLLSCMPLQLRIRGKSTTQSHRSAIYYVDLTVREGATLEQTIVDAQATDDQRKQSGYDQDALDQAGRIGFSNAEFEFTEDDTSEVLEEFYSAEADTTIVPCHQTNSIKSSLRAKLDQKFVKISNLSA